MYRILRKRKSNQETRLLFFQYYVADELSCNVFKINNQYHMSCNEKEGIFRFLLNENRTEKMGKYSSGIVPSAFPHDTSRYYFYSQAQY